jgi:hypothetical protein
MPDPKTRSYLNSLILSAKELNHMTDWPGALIEDYLNIFGNLILLADTIDIEIDQKIEEITTDFLDGSVLFAEGDFVVEDNANFNYDNLNDILNIIKVVSSSLTASKPVFTDANKQLVSTGIVPVDQGGTGAVTLTNGGIILGSGTAVVTVLAQAVNGQLPIGSTGGDPILATITGTANQVVVTNAAGSITLSLPQDIHTGASPTFVTETLTGLTASQLVKTDAGKTLASTIGTVQVPICMDMYDAIPIRGTESSWHGGLLELANGQPLDTVPTDIVVTKGNGKLIIVINAGTDLVGEITITGSSVDRNTGVITPGDTDTIVVDALTTDNTSSDANGNVIHEFVGAYISSKWFTGSVTLSTVDLTLTDVDVYHCSFEQSNDSPNLVINTFDANIFTTNVAAEFDAYLYTIHVTGNKVKLDREAELHVGAVGETAIANKYWRLRQGEIDEDLDGLTDGFFVDVFYDNSPVYVEDVTISVWLTKTVTVELS